ncbi:MAG TPA: dihydrodipicolinate synthase family protein, partial [Chitinophaga sp.]|uniref:dihydrodipicolinate synthase family protein n=1 Tax=Chitinophaga sp. TaxID=1869181 RepID=UPI002F95C0B5
MRIQGLIAATFSTFNEDGSLDLSLIPGLVERLISEGVQGVFICGTNGEGPNLTTEERMTIAEAYVKAVNKRCLVLVHVGHPSIAEARKLAMHAKKIGADAISAVAAFYFKPVSVSNLVDCMAEIAAAAPDMPFYYYHIPVITGMGIDMLEFLRLAEGKIPNLAGIKYTAATLHEYQA